MRRLFAGALVIGSLAACSFQHGALTGDGSTGDGPRDGRGPDTPLDACVSFSTHLDTCMPMVMPGSGLVLSGSNSYDTDTQVLTTPNGATSIANQIVTTTDGGIVVLLVSSFTVNSGATLRITGVNDRRAFGIVSYGHVQIDGLLDLSDAGAGSRADQTCSDLGLKGHKGADDNGGGSGGGGGGFAGAGGGGCNGDKDMNSDGGQSTGAAGGNAATARPTHITGGCDGGGGGDAAGKGGNGGHGGGAIFVASGNSITIGASGAINAGGSGGKGGLGNGGGGAGGGSGGMIVLESSSVSIFGKLAANGGGGGEGADGADGNDGATGSLSTSRASGGSAGAPEGGDGAGGGAGANAAGVTATQLKNGGGGGGGGGVGFIAIGPGTPVLNNATISPQFDVWP